MTDADWMAVIALAGAVSIFTNVVISWATAKYRSRQAARQGWPTVEQFKAQQPDTWQAQHRRAHDKPKLRPMRRGAGEHGNARISKARMRSQD